tara:strand:+ start:517 stop:708 length:192 start_codon:yes stop_codon:yes gene_type:complete
MHIINPNYTTTTPEQIAEMQSQLEGLPDKEIDDIRAGSELFADLTDGEIVQIAIDAGFIIGEH